MHILVQLWKVQFESNGLFLNEIFIFITKFINAILWDIKGFKHTHIFNFLHLEF